MFRITERLVQCLAKNYKNYSIMSVDMDKVGVMVAYSRVFSSLYMSAFIYSELHTRAKCRNMLP